MAIEIIGAGFGRTGTLSLKVALERLGFRKCYHMTEVMRHPEHIPIWSRAHDGEAIDWGALFEGYRASVDWPSCNFWREQLAAFPDAKVLLTVRDPVAWHTSVMNTIWPGSVAAARSDDPRQRAFGEWVMRTTWDGVFGGQIEDRDHAIAVFEAHAQGVRDAVPADRLLEFEARDGWPPLCDFLEVPIPDEPYPRTNSTEEFIATGGAQRH